MAFPLALVAGGALLGAMAGGQGTKGQSQTTSINVGGESELERLARLQQEQGFGDLSRIQRENFGQANQASQAYGNLLQQYQKTGGLPTSADLTQARSFAEQALAPQQAQIDLAMRQSTEAAREQAALSGRGPTDFALNTKLAGQRSDLMSQLGAQQAALGAQYAQQLSQNRLGFAGQFADLQQGLATQAMQNRMAIMGLGSQIQQAGQNFRVNTASRTSATPDRPGGLMGQLTGAFSGAMGAMSLGNAFGALGGLGSASAAAGAAAPAAMNFGQGLQMPSLGASTAASPNYLGMLGGSAIAPASTRSIASMPSSPVSAFTTPVPAQSSSMGTWPGIQGNPWDFNVSNMQGPAQIGMPFPNVGRF